MTISISWNVTSLATEDANLKREIYGAPAMGPLTADWRTQDFPGHGAMVVGDPIPQPREFSFVVQSTMKTGGLNRSNDEVAALASLFSPLNGIVKCEFTRKDAAAADVTRYLLALSTGAPGWIYTSRGGEGDGIRPSGRIRTTVAARCPFPYFIASTAAYDNAAINPTAGNITVPNPGDRWTGWRLEVMAGTTYSGDTLTITDTTDATNEIELVFAAGGLEVGTIMEYWYPAAPLGHPLGARSYLWNGTLGYYQRGLIAVSSGTGLKIPVGGTDLSIAASGGTGVVALKFTSHPIYFSM